MKPVSIVTVALGVILTALGVFGLLVGGGAGSVIPVIIGASLVYLGWRGGRRGLVIFGHGCIVIGCYMTAWGVHLAQVIGSAPTWLQILTQPLFWGLFSIFGGICANFHAFCSCVQRMAGEKKLGCSC